MRAKTSVIIGSVVLSALVFAGGSASACALGTAGGTAALPGQGTSASTGTARATTSVAEVQRLLNLAVDPATFDLVAVDGVFGPRTKAKLRVFEQCAGLVVDGRIDPETVAALEFWASSGSYVC